MGFRVRIQAAVSLRSYFFSRGAEGGRAEPQVPPTIQTCFRIWKLTPEASSKSKPAVKVSVLQIWY